MTCVRIRMTENRSKPHPTKMLIQRRRIFEEIPQVEEGVLRAARLMSPGGIYRKDADRGNLNKVS